MADPTEALEKALYAKLSGDATLAALLPGAVHLVTVTATGGTFTLTFNGAITAAIAYNATAATVQMRLIALATVGTGNVAVTGSVGGPFTVTFAGTLAGTVLSLTGSGALLTGEGAALVIAQRAAVHNPIAPDNAAYPFLVFQKISGTPHNALGQRTMWEFLYQFRVIGQGLSKVTILQALSRIDALLERGALTITGPTVKAMLREGDLPDLPSIEAGTVYQQVGATWRITVQEA